MLDMKKTKKWLNLRLTAHVQGYVKAVQDQELNTKETQRRREKKICRRNGLWIPNVECVIKRANQCII